MVPQRSDQANMRSPVLSSGRSRHAEPEPADRCVGLWGDLPDRGSRQRGAPRSRGDRPHRRRLSRLAGAAPLPRRRGRGDRERGDRRQPGLLAGETLRAAHPRPLHRGRSRARRADAAVRRPPRHGGGLRRPVPAGLAGDGRPARGEQRSRAGAPRFQWRPMSCPGTRGRPRMERILSLRSPAMPPGTSAPPLRSASLSRTTTSPRRSRSGHPSQARQ